GIPSVIEEALTFMGPAAKYLQFGVSNPEAVIRVNPFQLFNKDWTLLGSMAINRTFIPALHWLKERRIDVEPLVSKTLTLEEAADYFRLPKDPNELKIHVNV